MGFVWMLSSLIHRNKYPTCQERAQADLAHFKSSRACSGLDWLHREYLWSCPTFFKILYLEFVSQIQP